MTTRAQRALVTSAALVAALAPATARAESRGDLFGGYSLAREDEVNRHGWNASLAYTLRDGGRLALAVDLSGHARTVEGVDSKRLSFTAGPRLALFRSNGATFFAHVLAGGIRESGSLSVLGVTISESETRLGGYAGGGLDLRLRDTLALRAMQLDYVFVSGGDGGESSGSLRVSAGLVLRFGR